MRTAAVYAAVIVVDVLLWVLILETSRIILETSRIILGTIRLMVAAW